MPYHLSAMSEMLFEAVSSETTAPASVRDHLFSMASGLFPIGSVHPFYLSITGAGTQHF